MYSIDIKNNKEIYDYCMHNGITDINKFVQDCFKQGYDIKKYGLLGKTLNEGEKDLKTVEIQEKEVIVEKIVEVPVEVIKEVEKIVEVPVEKIIEKVVEIVKEVPVDKVVVKEVVKEVPVDRIVEKEIYMTDDKQVQELSEKMSKKNEELEELRREFSTKATEMENIFQNEMSKKNKELDELRHSLDELLDKPPVEIVKEVEKIVEVIKEIEKIIEVPVEKVVTKIEHIRDENIENQLNEKIKLLQETLQNLRSELQQKNEQIKELEKINRELLNGPNQGYLLRGSNLNRRI